MKEGWELHTLGDVATFINGDRSTNYPSKKDYVVDGIPFVNAGNLIQTGLDIASLNFISQDKYDSLTQGSFVEGDILFCLRGTLGKHSIVQNGLKGAVASSLVIIRTKDGFCNKYISYYLDYKQPFIERLNNGAAQPNIPAKTMKGFSIQFPPNEKQQQSIVEYLDSAFAKIDAMKTNAEKALNEAKALFQASLKEMLEPKEGWEEKLLPEISENLDSIRKPVTKGKRTAGIYPYYGASGIVDYVDDYLFDEDLLCISEDGANLLMRTYPIAFPISGKVWVNNHAHVLRFKSIVTQKYVEYCFSGMKLDEYITGAAQPKLTQKALNSIIINLPSTLDEQQSIVAALDSLKSKVDRLQENYDKISQECDALKQAILRQVFE